MALVAAGSAAICPISPATGAIVPISSAVALADDEPTDHQGFSDILCGHVPHKLRDALMRNTPWPDLVKMRGIASLSLTRAGFTSREFAFLPSILKLSPNLLSVDASVNIIGQQWTSVLEAGFEYVGEDLMSLTLWGCSISDLTGLNLAFEHANRARSRGLRTLGLGFNDLCPSGLRALPAALKETPKLTSLDLSRNPLGEGGTHYLSLALEKTPALLHLNLGECKLGPRGAKHLAHGLYYTVDLQEIYLQCNEIGPRGAWDLVEAFQSTQQMAIVDLSWNGLGHEGVRALAFAFQNCRKLSRIALGGNSLDPSVEREVSTAIRQTATGLLLPPQG